MRILIDAIAARLGGNITVLRNLLSALVEEDGGRHQYLVLGRRDLAGALEAHPRVSLRTSGLAEWNVAARLAWEQLAIPAMSRSGDVDLIFAPSGVAVLGSPVPQVVMFQNAAPFDEQVLEPCPPLKRARLLALQKIGIASARAADRVVFISQFQRELLSRKLAMPTERGRTIYLGRDPQFAPAARLAPEELKRRYGLNEPFLLSVSHFYHYKNIVELVQGFARALPQLPPGVQLALAGAEHERDYSERVHRTVREEGLEGRVIFLGNVPHQELPALYASASLFIFPSQCESFPNILIEGMSAGAPTIASRAGPMPELAGDAADYFDGTDPESIAASLRRVSGDPALAGRLAARGPVQVSSFSWRSTARELLAVFDELSRGGETRMGGTGRGTGQYFGEMAKTWDQRYAKSNFGERMAIVRRWLEGRAPGKMLDLGCGSGRLSVVARELGWRTVCLDLSMEMLGAARETGATRMVQADAERVPLRSRSVEAALSFAMLEYVPHPEQVLAELARVLKPGGTLLITMPNHSSGLRWAESAVAALRKRKLLGERLSARLSWLDYLEHATTRLTQDELRAMIEKAGFALESSGHFTPANFPGHGLAAIGMNSWFVARRGDE